MVQPVDHEGRMRQYVEEEGTADSLVIVTPTIIPGPLQTKDYFMAVARAEIRSGTGPWLPQARIGELAADHARRLEAIRASCISGATAAWYIGTEALSQQAMRGELSLSDRETRQQYNRLVEAAGWSSIAIFRTPRAPFVIPVIEQHDDRTYIEAPHGMIRVQEDDLPVIEHTIGDVRNLVVASGPDEISAYLGMS